MMTFDFPTQSYFELIENASDAIYCHDARGVFFFVNRKAEELTGYSKKELLRRHISVILQENGERLVREELRKHKSLKWNKKFELEIRAKNHALIPVELSMSPIVRQKKLLGFEGIARDIRERKEAQKMLQEREARIQQLNVEIQKKNMRLEEGTRIQTEFVSNVTHEFRTPLNGIIGYTDLLLDESYGGINQEQRSALINIKSGATELLRMVQEILDLSRLKSNQLKLELDYCSPNDLVEATLGTIEPIAKSKGIDLVAKMENRLPLVYVDFSRIYQVFVNLAENSVKFTLKGKIEIGATREEDQVKFYVKDTGIGISTEMKDMIFQEFRQGDGSTTRYFGGIGLGLSLSKRLVELHRGEIGVQSQPEHGSFFYFTIPLRNDQKPSEA